MRFEVLKPNTLRLLVGMLELKSECVPFYEDFFRYLWPQFKEISHSTAEQFWKIFCYEAAATLCPLDALSNKITATHWVPKT